VPRSSRIDAPGAVHHVMVRGVDRTWIFRDDTDRARFVDTLRRVVLEEQALVYAWALMPNHVHLVLRSGPPGISRLMARAGTAHAQAINRRHGRVGHLFQDRFKSIPVESGVHLRWLTRYVHRNPLEAGLVETIEALDTYPWTGHRELLGGSSAPLAAVPEVLAWFAPSRTDAVRSLRRWMSDVEEPEPPRVEALADPILLRAAVQTAIDRVAGAQGVDPREVWNGARTRPASRARALAVQELHETLGLSISKIERVLGLSRGAGARALRRARAVRHQTEPSPSSGGYA